jgi:hypothetical protein
MDDNEIITYQEKIKYTDNNVSDDIKTMFDTVFNKSSIVLVIWFLAIYFVSYFILGFFFKSGTSGGNFQSNLSRTLDFIILAFLLIFMVSSYLYLPEEKKQNVISDTGKSINNYVNKPSAIISTLGFIFLFYVVIYLFRIPMEAGSKSIFVSFVESGAWITLLITVIIQFFKMVLNKNITDTITTTLNWSDMPSDIPISGNTLVTGNPLDAGNTLAIGNLDILQDLHINQPTDIIPLPDKDEVFNISNNLYTYDDAQAVCSVYGAQVATYDQIEDAYEKGAEWCNYGWSDKQMVFFPTQKSTWDKLQQHEKTKNSCGRPGINGGYMANPKLKFGVNCFGKKPNATDSDLARMNAKSNITYPKSNAEIALEKKVQFWKEHADKLLRVNSYNHKQWSEY